MEDSLLTEEERTTLVCACESGNCKTICEAMLRIENLRKCLLSHISDEIDKTASKMTNRKFNRSILMQKSLKDMKTFNWFDVVDEFRTKFPDLMAILLSIMTKRENQLLYTGLEKVLPRLGAVYGILLQSRCQELSLIQRINSLLLFDNITDVKVFDRLQRQGVCLSYDGSLYVLENIGGKFSDSLIDLLKEKQRFRIVVDNINWRVGVHDQRFDHTSHMVHAFGSAILVQNIDFTNCPNESPQKHFETTSSQEFLPSPEDYAMYRRDYIVLMSRVVFQHIPYFQLFEECVPVKLSHECDPLLSKKTKVIPRPVLHKNEKKTQDVAEIFAFYEKIITEACDAAGTDRDELFVHIGGDQLTRERFSQAKSVRAHEDNPVNRFENLSPITFEFFHMHMNFLKMAYEVLYDGKSARDIRTMKSLQNRISRTNVNDNVAAHYDADKDFFISVVDMHIAECFMEFFGMQDVNSIPTQNAPPPEFRDVDHKKRWYFETVGRLLDCYVFSRTNLDVDNVKDDGAFLEIPLPDGTKLSFRIPEKGQSTEKDDGVMNYAKRVLELGLLFKDLLDATKLPERQRHISLLKLTMLMFKSHKNLSKYALEILRLLVHQICILTERASKEEFYGLFVNTNGHSDGHIPADRRMEYLVKRVKDHIKHIYSNKTEGNIKMRSSTIASVIDVGERYDQMSNVLVRTQRHSDKSSISDERILLQTLREVRPFRKVCGRHHDEFPHISESILDNLTIQHYHKWIETRKNIFAVELGN